MRLSAALLCDFASTRGGVLTIVGGGINQIRRPSFPGSLGVMVAIAMEPDEADFGRAHSLRVTVRGEGGVAAAEITGTFEVSPMNETEIVPGLKGTVPIVMPLAGVILPAPGIYQIVIYLNHRKAKTLPVVAREVPPQTE